MSNNKDHLVGQLTTLHCTIRELGVKRGGDMVTQTTGSLLASLPACHTMICSWNSPSSLSLICRVRLISPLSLSSLCALRSESAVIAVTWLVSREMGQLRCCQAETMATKRANMWMKHLEMWRVRPKKGKKVGVFKIEQERQKSGKRINGSRCLNNSSS